MEENTNKYEIYTDLALEERERFETNVEVPGVVLEKERNHEMEMTISVVEILDEEGAKAMGKPIGNYVTLESPLIKECDTQMNKKLAKKIAVELKKLIPQKDKLSILIVGLGNIKATPDALGPQTVSMINIRDNIYCIAPGVLAQTGMETYKIVNGIVGEVNPDVIIAIDSLAARNTARVATTIQISDTGISPGSGVGNHRMGLHEESLGVPVIAIGVPMVVNSVTIVSDTMEQLLDVLSGYEELRHMTESFDIFNKEEKYGFIEEVMTSGMAQMYVTPKDVDELISNLSAIIAEAINQIVEA